MSKSISVLPPNRRRGLDATFQDEVRELAKEGAALVRSYSDLTMRMLRFARRFRRVSETARRLDGDESGSVHLEHLHAVLREAVKSENRSIWSQWNTIGEHAPKLLAYSAALPPQRDSLYEMALAVKERLPIKAWIKDERITSTSTVREVKALRSKKRRKKPKANADRAMVTLVFSTYTDAANTLEDAFRSTADFSVQANVGFRDAMKAKLGRDEYERQRKRFA